MNAQDNTPRFLGAAFLAVVVTSLTSGLAIGTATGSGDIADVLATVADHTGLVHVAVLIGMLNAVGILVLAGLLYAVLNPWGKTLALIATLCWTGESFVYTLNQIASNALTHVASDFQSAGGADGSSAGSYESLGQFLYTDVAGRGGTILMFFYCAGGLLFYYLFFISRMVPRWISGYGLVVVTVGIVGASIELLGPSLGIVPYIAILPFELVIGVYLLSRGGDTTSTAPAIEMVAA